MLRPCFYLSILLIILSAAFVQTAPIGIAVMGIDRIKYPPQILDFDYARIDKVKLQQLRLQWEEENSNTLMMQYLQLNMMKIMFMLDIVIVIWLCVFIKDSS